MQRTDLSHRLREFLESHTSAIVAAILVVGFVLRLVEASQTYLNPDEAHYFWMSLPNELQKLYHNVLETRHPALLILLTHYVMKISDAELALRMIPIAAGTLFPLFVYLWLGRTWNKLAGLFALTILTLSPNIVSLSAQLRAYTLVLLFMSASLYFLDRAIDEESVLFMALSAGLLYLGTFFEYSFAFFAGSLAIYFLFRVRGQNMPRTIMVAWLVTQVGAVALYGFHYVTQIRTMIGHPGSQIQMAGWLRGAFPGPGDNPLVYITFGTVKQFAYTFASIPGGIAMGCAFLFGLILLWQGRSREERPRTRAVLALFIIPFLLACAGGLARIHPYARTRHTVLLAVFIAACVGVALERLVRTRTWTFLPAMLLLIPFWLLTAVPDQHNIRKGRHQRATMLAGIHYLQKNIPPGSLIFTDVETRSILNYYLGPGKSFRSCERQSTKECYTDYRLVAVRYSYADKRKFVKDFVAFRKKYEIDPEESVWVVDGGFNLISLKSEREDGLRGMTDLKDFGRVLTVFQTPPRYGLSYL